MNRIDMQDVTIWKSENKAGDFYTYICMTIDV